MTQPDNPLTALRAGQSRLAVPLRPRPGRHRQRLRPLGRSHVHPELLDWLASRFVQDGWSLKQTGPPDCYLRSLSTIGGSNAGEQGPKKDPEVRLLWRFPARRLDAEQVRDAHRPLPAVGSDGRRAAGRCDEPRA